MNISLWQVSDVNRAYLMLALFTAGGMLIFYQRLLYAPVVPLIQEEFNLEYLHVGLVPSAMMILTAIGYIASGYLIYKYRNRKIIIIAFIACVATATVTGTAQNYLQLVTFQSLIGICESLYYLPAVVLIAYWFPPEKLGKAVGTIEAGLNMGSFTVFGVGGIIALAVGWRTAYMLIAIPALIITALLYKFVKEPENIEVSKPSFQGVLNNSYAWILASLSAIFFLDWYSIWEFAPTYLVNIKGLSITFAGFITSVMLAIATPLAFIGGALADKFSPKKIGTIYFSILAASIFIIGSTLTILWTAIALLIAASLLVGIFPILVKAASQHFPLEKQTAAYTLLLIVGY
ncbi:MAG: MFS transporter, partial [Crenarchaeota archaeon]|nr:MFS transporter [Thermoproteota archaeon]